MFSTFCQKNCHDLSEGRKKGERGRHTACRAVEVVSSPMLVLIPNFAIAKYINVRFDITIYSQSNIITMSKERRVKCTY